MRKFSDFDNTLNNFAYLRFLFLQDFKIAVLYKMRLHSWHKDLIVELNNIPKNHGTIAYFFYQNMSNISSIFVHFHINFNYMCETYFCGSYFHFTYSINATEKNLIDMMVIERIDMMSKKKRNAIQILWMCEIYA